MAIMDCQSEVIVTCNVWPGNKDETLRFREEPIRSVSPPFPHVLPTNRLTLWRVLLPYHRVGRDPPPSLGGPTRPETKLQHSPPARRSAARRHAPPHAPRGAIQRWGVAVAMPVRAGRRSAQSSRNSRTLMLRPSRLVSLSSAMALVQSSTLPKRTTPHPLERPLRIFTSAPMGLKSAK